MTPQLYARQFDDKLIGIHLNATQLELLAKIIANAQGEAVEADRRERPHVFTGRLDRDCEVCGEPDRDARHFFSRESVRASVEMEREASIEIAKRVGQSQGAFLGDWPTAELIVKLIRARSTASHSAAPAEK